MSSQLNGGTIVNAAVLTAALVVTAAVCTNALAGWLASPTVQ